MIIEFVGPPGAGKTTIATVLAALMDCPVLPIDGYHRVSGEVMSRAEIATQRVRALATQPRLTRTVISCARTEGRGLALTWMLNLARRNEIKKRLPPQDIVLEEGPLSALCFAKAARTRPWEMLDALPLLAQGDVVVAVHTRPETAVKRIINRMGILSDRSPTELGGLVARYDEALRSLCTGLMSPTLHVRGDEDSSSVAQSVQRQIAELLRTDLGGPTR